MVKITVLLLSESHASKTVFAADAVITEITVSAIFQILRVGTVVAVIDVDAFVAEFAIFADVAVGAVAAADKNSAVKTVLVIVRGKEQVAVLIFV